MAEENNNNLSVKISTCLVVSCPDGLWCCATEILKIVRYKDETVVHTSQNTKISFLNSEPLNIFEIQNTKEMPVKLTIVSLPLPYC